MPASFKVPWTSVIGPTAYVINASDLKTLNTNNSLDKYADDTYLIVPASKSLPYRQNWIMSPSGQQRIISHSMCPKAVRWLFAVHSWQSTIQTSPPSPARSGTCEWTQNSGGIHVGQIRIYPSHKLHLQSPLPLFSPRMPLESSERMGWLVPNSGKWAGQRLLLNSPILRLLRLVGLCGFCGQDPHSGGYEQIQTSWLFVWRGVVRSYLPRTG